MGEIEALKTTVDGRKSKSNVHGKAFDSAVSTFFVRLPHRFQNFVKSRLQRLGKDSEGANSMSPLVKTWKGSSVPWEVDLEKQMQAWRENPSWVDQPSVIKVSIPKGSFCNLSVNVNVGLPPDAVYNIVIDPDNKRVFKNIKEVISRKVLVDEGSRQLVEVEQAALWKFLWWSGTINVHVLADQNREDHSMKFKQLKTGFMKKFEGCWTVDPLFVDEELCFPFKPKTLKEYCACSGGKGRVGSKVRLEQVIQPAIVPPPPISWYLRGITTKTTEMLINDLLAEAASIRGGFGPESPEKELESKGVSDEPQVNSVRDIKERWALHRRNHRRRLTAK